MFNTNVDNKINNTNVDKKINNTNTNVDKKINTNDDEFIENIKDLFKCESIILMMNL